jgi:hypothetical protein
MIEATNQRPDKLAQRIAERRAAAARESVSDGNWNRQMATSEDLAQSAERSGAESAIEQAKFDHIARGLAGAVVNANCDKIVWVSEAIASGENPITVARLLAALGLSNKELAAALGKSKAWVSKRLGLLEAPITVQRLIESGDLSESEYYNNRRNIQSGIKNTNGVLKYQRIPTIEISLDAARSLATILSNLAVVSGAAPIKLELDTNKKRIVNILNERAGEILKRFT